MNTSLYEKNQYRVDASTRITSHKTTFLKPQCNVEHSVVTSGPRGKITMEHAVLEIHEQGETHQEENYVEETGYEHINFDDTSHMDAENKKRKGKKFKGNKK
nr:hypothetical protein [Tanacetum cinerariifolium]